MWSQGLLETIKNPDYIVHNDERVVIIKDMYPKAKYHFLVVPNEDIAGIRNVNHTHLPLLEYMHSTAENYVKKNFPNIIFKFGYHAQPSMYRLHLHVISNDMVSGCLKTKKHWNSFTTEFLLNSSAVIEQLKTEGKFKLPTATECENLLSKSLKCHRCDLSLPNMPKLKQHIETHS